MILVIDNYDSFTYNIVQEMGELGAEMEVIRNDKITLVDIQEMQPSHIVISPGPGYPKDAGISREIIREMGENTPILGICLGHQCIGEVYGGVVTHAPKLMHGKTSPVYHKQDPLFTGVPGPFIATRYHSLIVEEESLPEALSVIAFTENGENMAMRHQEHPVIGVQFHPESILTEYGIRILQNFLDNTFMAAKV
ncbi:MAG: anthranilate synthase component II [Aggregatilineales bacterium]